MKKSVFTFFVATMVLLGCLTSVGLFAGADELHYAKVLEQDGITVNGDLSDWAGVEKYPLSVYDAASGNWTVSETDFVQVAASADSIYVALTVSDSEKSHDGGIKRDHIRISAILPDGSLGLMYTDNDVWTQVTVADLQGWWGVPADTFTNNAFIPANSTSLFTYNENGTVTVEARACMKEPAEAASDPVLKAGDEIQLAIQYLNDENCTAQAFEGTAWYAFGTTALVADTADEIAATFKLAEKPQQEAFTYEAIASVGGAEMDIVEGVSKDLEADFWEWEDEADGLWKAAEKYPLDVYDAKQGIYVQSESEYVQFKYAYGQLYFRIHTKDADGKSADGLIRDGVFFTAVFPDNTAGHFFYGTDAADSVVWKEWSAESWFNGEITGDEACNKNAFTNENTTACFYYDSGYVDVEGRATVKDPYKDYFVSGTELKIAIAYRDKQTVNGTAYEGGNWAKWGTTDITCMDESAVTGTVTLYDPTYRDTAGMEVAEATSGAENDTYSFAADNTLTVTVKATEGAAVYRVNVFDRWDETTFIGNTWEESETTTLTVAGLDEGLEMTYQVVAMNEAGEIIAVYPAVNFVVGVNPSNGDKEDNGGSGEDTDKGNNKENDKENDKGGEDNKTDSGSDDVVPPETGVTLPIAAMMIFAAASGAVVAAAKKYR